MIDATRRELLKLIEELSAVCPEHRFGQLVLNLAFMAREDGDSEAWHYACGCRTGAGGPWLSGGGEPDPGVKAGLDGWI